MNRIERLIWEETQLNRIERLNRESPGTTGAQVISIMFLVGLIALFATRPSLPPVNEAIVKAPVAQAVADAPVTVPNPAIDRRPTGATLSRNVADAAARAAR